MSKVSSEYLMYLEFALMILGVFVGSCRARKADTLTIQQTGSVRSLSRTVSQH